MSTGNNDGLFDDFSENTSSPDLEGGLFDDFSEEEDQDTVVTEEKPSTPVVGKKKEDTVSESDSISEEPLSVSKFQETDDVDVDVDVDIDGQYSSLEEEEKVLLDMLPEDMRAKFSQVGSVPKSEPKPVDLLKLDQEEAPVDISTDLSQVPLTVDVPFEDQYDLDDPTEIREEATPEFGGFQDIADRIKKIQGDISLRNDLLFGFSAYDKDQLKRTKDKAIQGFDEDNPVRREYDFNSNIEKLTKGEDALRTAKFGSNTEQGLLKAISDAKSKEDQKSLSDKMDGEIRSLMSENDVPGWYNAGLNTLQDKAKALSGLRSIDKQVRSIKDERNVYLNDELFSEVNEDIESIKEKLMDGEISKEDAQKAISAKKALKNNFFETDGAESAKNALEGAGETHTVYKDFLKSLSEREDFKNLPAKEKFDNFYLTLNSYAQEKAAKAGLTGEALDNIGTQLRDHFNIEGDFFGLPVPDGVLSLTDEEIEALDALKAVKSLESVFYNNRVTNELERDNFFEAVWGSMYSSLFPETASLTNRGITTQAAQMETVGTLSEDGLGVVGEGINKEAVDALAEEATPRKLMGEGFSLFQPSTYGNFDFDWRKAGELAGSTGAIMFTMLESAAITKNLPASQLGKLKQLQKGTNLGKAYRNSKAVMHKTLRNSPRLSKYVAPAFKEGMKFEVAGEIFQNQGEELNFLSGFLGKLGGELTEGVISKLAGTGAAQKVLERYNAVFGPKTKAAIEFTKKAFSRGSGEVQEETIQELTNIWQQTPEGKSFLEELRTRFPDMSSVEEFMASSFIMGNGMGIGGKNGAIMAAIEKYRSSKDAQGNPNPTKALDEVMSEVATDVKIAEEQAKKETEGVAETEEAAPESITEEEAAPEAETVTEETPATVEGDAIVEETEEGAKLTDEETGDTEVVDTAIEEEVAPEATTEEEVVAEEAVEDDLDAKEVVKELTPEQERTNRLLSYVNDHKNAKGKNQKAELGQKINAMASSLGLTVKQNKDGSYSILNDKGGKVTSKSAKTKYKEQPQSDIDAVKKAIEGGVLDSDGTTIYDLPGISQDQVREGIKNFKEGKYNLENAKALVIGFRNARKQGGFGVSPKTGNNYETKPSTFVELDSFESEMAGQTEEVMTEEAAREVPQNVQDAIMAAEADLESLPDNEQSFVDTDEDVEVDSVESMSDEQVDSTLEEAQEALGATDEEIAQLAEVIKENNKQDKDGEQEQGKDIPTTEAVVEDDTSSEQKTEQVKEKPKNAAAEASRRLAESIRKNKLKNIGGMMSGGPQTLLFDTAMEAIALALEGGATVIEAISAAIDAMRKSPAWKKITPEERKKIIKKFKKDINDSLSSEYEEILSEVEEEAKAKPEGKKESSTPKPPKKSKKDSEDTPSERNKSFLNRVLADPDTPPAHKEMLSDIETKYTQESNEWQSDQADILIDVFEKGGRLNDLWAQISDLNTDMSFGVRAMIALKMRRLHDEKGRHKRAAEVSDWIDKTARKFGQFNQALVDRGTPESVLRSKEKEWSEKADTKMKRSSNSGSGKTIGEDVNEAVEEMNEASEKAAQEIADGVNLEEKVEEVKKKMSKKEALEKAREAKRQKREAAINKEKNVRKDLRNEMKKSRAKYFNASIGGFTAEGIELAGKIAASYVREGVLRLDKLAEKVRGFFKDDLDIDLTDSQVQEILNYSYEGKTAIQLLTDSKIEEAKVKLSKRVLNATKDKKSKPSTMDAIDVILKELTLKAKQSLPKQKKGETENQYRDRVLDAMASQDIAKEVWDDAQQMVEDHLEKKVNDGKMTPAEKAEVMEKLQGFFGDFVGRPFSDSVLEKAVSEQLKSMNQKIKDIITKHWTDKAAIGQDLAAKFVEGAGLSPEAAEALASEVLEEYNNKIEAAAEKALEKTLGPSKLKSKKAKKTETQKLIDAYNLGALDSDAYKNLFAEKFGLVHITDADRSAIGKFIHDLNLYPENSEALHRGMAEFNRYLKGIEKDSYKGKFFMEYLTEVFYTSVLSGFSTLARGVKGVAMTAAAELIIEAAKNPKLTFTTMQGVSALARGFKRGRKEFASIMKDGYVPISKNLENTTGNLDAIQNAKWSDLSLGKKANKAFFYIPVHMVRALIAADALAHYTVREFFATTAAYNKVLRDPMSKKSSDFWANVENELHNNKADENAARDQALAEKQRIIDGGGDVSKFDVERRTREILDGMRDTDIQEFANRKADKSRLGQDPEGMLGKMYLLAGGASRITGMSRIIPFLRIPTNAMDMWLDYTPWGLKRAAFGRGRFFGVLLSDTEKKKLKIGPARDNMSPDERIDHLIKASIGAVATTALAAAVLSGDEDDEDRFLQISYKGHGKFRDNEGLRNEGWKEMSFRFKNPFTGEYTEWFDYRDSPMAMIFATIGSIHDERKYKQAGKDEKDAEDLMWAGLTSSLLFTTEQNYTKSLMNLSNVFSREGTVGDNAANFTGDYVKKNVQATFYPNVYKQAYQTYKALIQKNEKMTTRYSDNWIDGVFEGLVKDVPYMVFGGEDNLENEMFDQLGYPITRRIEDVPLIPDMALDGMQTIISDRQGNIEKPVWDLFNKHKATLGWDGSRSYEGRDLDYTEQLKLKNLTANKVRQELELRLKDREERKYLYRMSRDEFMKEVQKIKNEASKSSKEKLFGEKKR